MKVIVVASEKDTGGFSAPSITVFPQNGWKENQTLEKCFQGAQNYKQISLQIFIFNVYADN